MAQKYVPKPISFVPPILKRKFIAPDNPREMGTLVMLIGLAVIVVSAWPAISDANAMSGTRAANATYVGTAPFRSGNTGRIVGVYVFRDETNSDVGTRSNRVYANATKIPKKARVVWPSGRSQKAQLVGEYNDYLLSLPIGLAIFGFGLWLRRKRVDAYALAMNPVETDNPTTPL